MKKSSVAVTVLGAVLGACASDPTPQATTSGTWSCTLNGRPIDIRIAGSEATVTFPDGTKRVLKRVGDDRYYTDGSAALRAAGADPYGLTSAQWVERGEANSLYRCQQTGP